MSALAWNTAGTHLAFGTETGFAGVVDLSKNRSKRFCEAGCGNRAAVTAYRARRAAACALPSIRVALTWLAPG